MASDQCAESVLRLAALLDGHGAADGLPGRRRAPRAGAALVPEAAPLAVRGPAAAVVDRGRRAGTGSREEGEAG